MSAAPPPDNLPPDAAPTADTVKAAKVQTDQAQAVKAQVDEARQMRRFICFAAIATALLAAYFLFDLGRFFNLAFFKSHQAAINAYFDAHPWRTASLFALLYITVTALSFPGTVLLTLCAGAVFGVLWGALLVSFASALGATLAFTLSRYLWRDWVQRRFGVLLAAFNQGVERDGAFYLVSLGLIPVVPYFIINLVMGLTPMRTFTFYWASQTGMLLETILIVNAGTQLAQVESLTGLLSPVLLASLALLGLIPLLVKKLMTHEKMPHRWRPTLDK